MIAFPQETVHTLTKFSHISTTLMHHQLVSNVYSFALKQPEERTNHRVPAISQRIDNATLILAVNGLDGSNDSASAAKTVSYTLRVYAVNYNVLRIMSGMGGLAYSN